MRYLYFKDQYGWTFTLCRSPWFPVTLHVAWAGNSYFLGIGAMRNGNTVFAFAI